MEQEEWKVEVLCWKYQPLSDLWSSSVEREAVTILLLMVADSICTFLLLFFKKCTWIKKKNPTKREFFFSRAKGSLPFWASHSFQVRQSLVQLTPSFISCVTSARFLGTGLSAWAWMPAKLQICGWGFVQAPISPASCFQKAGRVWGS